MKPLHDWVHIEFLDNHQTDTGLWKPESEGSLKKAQVKAKGPEANAVQEGDVVFVKNFKPLGNFNGEDIVFAREDNLQCKVVEN